jgi:hypothetical protein
MMGMQMPPMIPMLPPNIGYFNNMLTPVNMPISSFVDVSNMPFYSIYSPNCFIPNMNCYPIYPVFPTNEHAEADSSSS